MRACAVKAGTPVACDASKDTTCLKSSCVPATGTCTPTPAASTTPCDDGLACTTKDVCKQGTCAGAWVCPCNPADGGKACQVQDGNLCNGTLACIGDSKSLYACVVDPKTVVTCSGAGNTACKTNSCAPQTGTCALVAKADNALCDDGDPCTAGDVCAAGVCTGATQTCNSGPTWSEVYQAAFASNGCSGCHGSYNDAQTTLQTLTTMDRRDDATSSSSHPAEFT